jgi:hypothetical protein
MRVRVLVVAALAFLGQACGPTVDLSTGLQVLDVTSGWFDVGIVNGQNKIVPSVTFKVKNLSDQPLVVLQINAIFRRVTENDEWGSGLITAAGNEGLAPGATSEALTIRSQQGYTSSEPRLQMLQNTHFIDAKVELSAKYGATQWKRVGDFPITRELLTK